MKFFLSSLILSLALLSACTKSQKQESKPVAVSIDTIPTMVMQILTDEDLLFGNYKLIVPAIVTHVKIEWDK